MNYNIDADKSIDVRFLVGGLNRNEGRKCMEQKVELFSNKALKEMIVPLFLEQLLMAFVGIADVFVVGFIGEAAVSGVSLVNSFNTIFLNFFLQRWHLVERW